MMGALDVPKVTASWRSFGQWIQLTHSLSDGTCYDLATSAPALWTNARIEALTGCEMNFREVPHSYGKPEGGRLLRQRVAEFLDTDPDYVIITNGASEALLLALSELNGLRETVLVPTPTYPGFLAIAEMMGMKTKAYPLPTTREGTVDIERIAEFATSRTAACIVNSPHNPTGAVLPHQKVKELAALLGDKGVALVIDEVFHPIYNHIKRQPSSAGLENVLSVGDLSKAFLLPGLRIGWLVVSDPVKRKAIIDLRRHISVSGAPLLEFIADYVLAEREPIIQAVQSQVARNMAIAQRVIGESRCITWHAPAGGTLAFPELLGRTAYSDDWQRLARSGVLVVPGSCFGSPQHFRVSLAVKDDGYERAIQQICSFCDSLPINHNLKGALR